MIRVNRPVLVTAAALVGIIVLIAITLGLTVPGSVRTRLTAALGERFGGTVEMDNLRVSLFPRPRVSADGVVVRHMGRTDVPPLITVKAVSADAGIFGLLGRPLRLRYVHLEGLEINIPPKHGNDDDDAEDADDQADDALKRAEREAVTAAPRRADAQRSDESGRESPLIVEDLLSERAMLRILRNTPGKRPREFSIERLSMQDTGANVPWAFSATLTNPTPPGQIAARGTFGPWNADSPDQTALAADYEFKHADLGHFKGIRGILHSTGKFSGVLERIDVEGTTDVPDFALADIGHPVHLRTRFRAVVDGTNGNTWLQPVEGRFGNTVVHTRGGVVEREGEDGRTVSLDIVIDEGRIEDVLALATKSAAPAMTGALKLTAKFELPPGHVDPEVKMTLTDGVFRIAEARFPKGGVQAKVNALSQKARGDAGDGAGDAPEVASDFRGRFVMGGGRIRFSEISFTIPGAKVNLAGVYAVKLETLDFRGTVTLDAKLSQLTTGPKAFLLKLVEPLFRRRNVTVIPITVKGNVDQPKFGLDVVRAFTPK